MKVKFATFLAFLMLIPVFSCVKEAPKADENPSIDASRSFISFPGSGGERIIEITANGEWKATLEESAKSWLHFTPDAAGASKQITLVADPNQADSPRTATVEFVLTAYPDVKTSIDIEQKAKGQGGNPDDPGEPEERGQVIPRANFTGESPWGITGSIMNLNWGNDTPPAPDIAMKEDVESGWVAAFDVVVKEGEEFKFRKDNSWSVNLGTGAGQPYIDRKYKVVDDGMDNNFKLSAGTYDIYLQPAFMIMYVENAGDEFAHGDAKAEQTEDENVRIFVLNNSTWTKPYMYAYADGGSLKPFGNWPGTYANGTKVFGDYTWTYWEASGFSGVGNISLILNNNGKDQYPRNKQDSADVEDEPLLQNLTIHNNLFFVWDGTTLTKVEDPSDPGVEGKGKTPDEVKFGTSSWTIIGSMAESQWESDIAMDTEGYWEVARDLEIQSTDSFKFRQNRSWGNNYGFGDYEEDKTNIVTVGAKLEMTPGGSNIGVATTDKYDIYLAAENKIAYILAAGSAWTHEAEGKPEYSGGGDYDPNLDPAHKLSGITYQINVFSFKDSNGDGYGDLKGITQSLDYFDKLGVTGLWLSPLQPAQSYHGYDVTDYEAINKKYGTEADFQELITEAHKHNIRIYMDYVINHAGDQSVWFTDCKDKGPASPYWDYFSLSKDPQADVATGKIAQTRWYDSGKWFPVLIGGKDVQRFKIDLDWTNASAPTMTVTETTAAPTTSGTYNNPPRYLQWGSSTTQFVDNGTNKYTLVLNYKSDWGCLVRTNSGADWPLGSKWGMNKSGIQLKLGVPQILYNSDKDNNLIQNIVMPGGDMYFYYTEFGTGMFVDFNYGPANSCASSNAFKAVVKSAKKWLEMGVDGFRLDAVKHIYADETGPENKAFWKAFYNACNEIYKGSTATAARADLTGWKDPNIFMVGEVLSGDGDCTPFYEGLPALFEFQFWWDLRECLNSESIYSAGYGQNFPGSLSYRWYNHQKVRGDAISTPKLANHDEDRTASTLGNYKPKVRLAAAVLLTSAGRPYIYQGEELGYWGTKAGGDEYVRTPILWTPSASSATSKGVSNKVDWNMLKPEISVERQAQDAASLLNLYRHFAYARSINSALADGYPEADSATADGYDGHIAGWYLHSNTDDKVVLVLHNFSSYTITVDRSGHGNDLSHILVSAGKVTVNGYNVTMPGYSSVVFALN